MKKILVLGLGLCACVASASLKMDGNAAVAFFPAPLADTDTVLSVPFTDCLTDGDIALDKLVSTSTLAGSDTASEADQLVLFKDGVYSYYYLNAAKTWVALKTTVAGADSTAPTAIAEQKLPLGYAVWLKKIGANTTTAIMKGRLSETPVTIEIVPGMNLVGNTLFADLDLNTVPATIWPADVEKDEILVSEVSATAAGGYATYRYHEGKWMKRTLDKSGTIPGTSIPLTKEVWSDIGTISAGTGFWYRRNGSTSFVFQPIAQ